MKKLVAALTTAIFVVALVLVGAAAPASAHTPTLTGTATCNTATGTWKVTYNFATTNVPTGVQASSKVTSYSPNGSTLSSGDGVGTGTNLTLSTFSTAPQNGVATRTGNWTATLTQTGIAASNNSASVTIHTDWSDKASGNASYTVHFTGRCGTPTPPATPKDASASVSKTAATCSAGETLVLGKTVNSSWQGQPSYSGANYTAIAKADSGHKFADGSNVTNNNSTETFTGSLAGKLSSTDPKCAPATPPACIPASAVHYTYSPAVNGGVITVNNVPNSTGKLCEGFYVTATSWVYTVSNSVWPQKLDVVNKYYIDSVGDHPYSATVHCGQGDIYAATAAAGQPNPPQQLNGPSNPWPEHFLHDMGFKGDSPTYTQSDISKCFTAPPITGTPKLAVATCTAPTGNLLSLPAVSGGVWTISSGTSHQSLAIGAGKDFGAVYGYGSYTITLTDGNPVDGHTVKPGSWTWSPVDISTVDCNTTVTPVDPTAHAVTTCGTTGSIVIPADTDAIKYTLTSGDGHSGTNVVTATALGNNEFAGTPPTKTKTWTFELGTPVDCIALTPGAPKVVDQTCLAGTLTGGSITVEDQTGLIFTLSGGPSNFDHETISGTTSGLLPGDYTVDVKIDNSTNPNYVFAAGAVKSFPVTINPALDCRTISVTATPTDAQCTATPNGTTPLTYVPGTVTVVGDPDVTFTISDGTTTSPLATGVTHLDPGTYTVTAQLTTTAQAAGAALPVSSWGPFVINAVDCTVQSGAVTPPIASTCFNLTSDTTLLSWVHLDATPNVSYVIQQAGVPASTTALAAGYTSEAPGAYTVIATADPGYKLDGAGTLTQQWSLTVADTTHCLPTGATWHAGASADPAVCVSTTDQLGTIHLTHLASEIGKVRYTITNNATGKVINAGSHATTVKVAPGTYTVRAKAVTSGDGISTASVFRNLRVAAASAVCSTLTSLAFTGQSASFAILGFLLAGGMLALGFAALFIRRANRRNAI